MANGSALCATSQDQRGPIHRTTRSCFNLFDNLAHLHHWELKNAEVRLLRLLQDWWAEKVAAANGWGAEGVFLDLGAHSGLWCSNTKLLEERLGCVCVLTCCHPLPLPPPSDDWGLCGGGGQVDWRVCRAVPRQWPDQTQLR